jgi:integrase
MKPKPKTWTPTKVQQLYRHSSGTFYARMKVGGKPTWRSLKTDLLSVAKAELEKILNNEAAREEMHGNELVSPRMTIGEAKTIRLKEIQNDVSLKTGTRHYWNQVATSLSRSWPGIDDLEARKITPAMCQDWAGKFAKSTSATRYNNAVSLLRQFFEVSMKHGARVTNPAQQVKRLRPKSKDLASKLPTKEIFAKWIGSIRGAGGRFSQDAGDFVEGLAYTGVRKGEAACITLADIDEVREEIIVRGDPDEGTKNSQVRRVPINAAMKDLIVRIKARRGGEAPDAPLFRVNEAQKSMDNAARKVGMERITHHDLRHYFATICIESGVDVPTVSKWLGHLDGGALAMQTYGHLRNEHSRAAAKKVSFAA